MEFLHADLCHLLMHSCTVVFLERSSPLIVLVRVKGEVLWVCTQVGLCLVNQKNNKCDNNKAFKERLSVKIKHNAARVENSISFIS